MKQLDAVILQRFVAVMASLLALCGTTVQNSDENVSNSRSLSARKSSCNLVLVSTLDGKMAALDMLNDGQLQWSIPIFSGPLLSSSLRKLQLTKQSRLVPSLDGGLYQVNEDKIEALPYNADNLLGTFLELPDGSMLIGAKEAKTCGIDPLTGKLRYVCQSDGCKSKETESSPAYSHEDVLLIKRTQQTMRAIDQRSGDERWNFSVGQQDLKFLDGRYDEGFASDCPFPNNKFSPKLKLRVSIPDGLVAGVHRDAQSPVETVVWTQKFDSPIAAVWMLNDGHLKTVDLFREDIMPEVAGTEHQDAKTQKPMMYIGSHEGQVYIQSSQSFSSDAISVNTQSSNLVTNQPQIVWRPYLSSSPSRTPTIVSKEIAVWNPVEYPFDNGYYLFGDVKPFIPPHCKGKHNFDFSDNATFEPRATQDIMDPKENFWDSWRGMLALGVVAAFIIQLFLRFIGKYYGKKVPLDARPLERMQSASVSTVHSSDSRKTLKLSTSPSALSLPSVSDTLTPSGSFISRYLSDFEHELCLGKGGFGVVFQAKNKLDDCQYAVKRIRLPNCEEAREKVMREVKALAKLSEHPGIVRYYNAWYEAPPFGWQEETDKQIFEVSKPLEDGYTISVETEPTALSDSSAIFMKECLSSDGISKGSCIRRRKKTSSSSRSRHSSRTASIGDDSFGKQSNYLCEADEYNAFTDVHDLENDAVIEEDSGSFSIEFVSNSYTGEILANGHIGHESSTSQSIVFADFSGTSEFKEEISKSSEESGSQPSKDSHSSMSQSSFTHRSLFSGVQHKCHSKDCTKDRLAAPLYLYIQMQLCQRQSLKDWLRMNVEREHLHCLQVFKQIIDAVEFFHGHGMIHRDLKPSNIFFSMNGIVKVGDFGLVTASHHVETNTESSTAVGKGVADVHHTGQVGTQLYMSPEQVAGKVYSYKVDVYSMGLIFFELFNSFSTQMERIKVLSDVKRNIFPVSFENKMPLQTQLVKWMLSESPKNRPTVAELKKCNLLREIDAHARDNVKLKSD